MKHLVKYNLHLGQEIERFWYSLKDSFRKVQSTSMNLNFLFHSWKKPVCAQVKYAEQRYANNTKNFIVQTIKFKTTSTDDEEMVDQRQKGKGQEKGEKGEEAAEKNWRSKTEVKRRSVDMYWLCACWCEQSA